LNVTFDGERLIERYFHLAEKQTTLRQELLGGLTTFLTMAYIIIVNQPILSQAGMPAEGVVFATCPSSAAATWFGYLLSCSFCVICIWLRLSEKVRRFSFL
jgi:xanthine/uracil/vitamin C permease (AzgA family)